MSGALRFNPTRAFVVLFALTWTSGALAECRVSFTGAGNTPVVQYDPFQGIMARARMALRLSVEDGSSGCLLGILAFDAAPGNGRRLSLGGDHLLYRLRTSDGTEIPNSNAGSGIAVNLAGTDASEVTLEVEVPAGEIGPAGLYQDELTLRLTDLSTGAQIGSDVSALVNTAIDSRAQINIAGASAGSASRRFAAARLDFGTLVQGEERNAIVQVRATAPVSISVSSEQGGAMRRQGGAETEPALAYQLTLDREQMDLALPATIQRTPPLQLNGGSYPLSVRIIGNPNMMAAGDYQDLLTIDVVPR